MNKNYQWFVIHTLSGQEMKVKEGLERRMEIQEGVKEYIREVLVPIEKVVEVRGGRKSVTNRKLYPGYVFINVALYGEGQRLNDVPWYFVQETQGAIGFVGGEHPMPTADQEVEKIKERIRESQDTEKPRVNFDVGETVKINDGPFLNFNGVIEEIDPERGKLKIIVSIFGRSTPVELEYWQVEKI